MQRRISGSGRAFSSDTENIIKDYLQKLHATIVQNLYKSFQIFNFDETSFYMDCPGNYSVSFKGWFLI